jgi:uncharacterized repeat protein (TIGR03837 family)
MLSVLPFNFLPLDEYDRLLWRCDINFVRGEDSFVRAQWAGRPFVWQIYQQEEAAHMVKLEAFLALYTAELRQAEARATINLYRAWNSAGDLREPWIDFLAARGEIAHHSEDWAIRLAQNPNLAESLVKFCASKV